MKRALRFCLVLAWFLGIAAFGQSLDWKQFTSRELGFSIKFPGTPTTSAPEEKADGSGKSTTTMFQMIVPNVFCVVGVTDYSFDFDADEEMTLDQDNFLKSLDATLVTSRRAEYVGGHGKLPERVFTFEYPGAGYSGRAIVIVQGTRVYMAIFAFKKGNDYTADMDTFLDSLELTGSPQG